MKTLFSAPTREICRSVMVARGWEEMPDGHFAHPGQIAWIEREGNSYRVVKRDGMITRLIAEIEEHAALREEGAWDRA